MLSIVVAARLHTSAMKGETRGDNGDDDEEQREEAEAAASWQRYLDATRERDAFAEGFVCGALVTSIF
jgi:hypothetical protein